MPRYKGRSGDAMVLGKLPVPGRPTIWITVGQGPTALAVGAGGVVWTFLLSSILSLLFLRLWETARYRLKYCLKGLLNRKQPTNQCPDTRLQMQVYSNNLVTKSSLEQSVCRNHGVEELTTRHFICSNWFVLSLFNVEIN